MFNIVPIGDDFNTVEYYSIRLIKLNNLNPFAALLCNSNRPIPDIISFAFSLQVPALIVVKVLTR